MDKRLLSKNDLYGTTTWWHYDEVSDRAVINCVQDAEGVIEANKVQHAQTDERARYNDGMHCVARLPMVVLQELRNQGITQDPARFKKWLNDPENRHFRTRPGRV